MNPMGMNVAVPVSIYINVNFINRNLSGAGGGEQKRVSRGAGSAEIDRLNTFIRRSTVWDLVLHINICQPEVILSKV